MINSVFESYEYRGRTLKKRIQKMCFGLFFFVIFPLIVFNGSYIRYLCAKADYDHISVLILEKEYAGNGSMRLVDNKENVLVEYRDTEGTVKQEIVKACSGDKVGKHIIIAVHKETGELARIHPTVNMLQILGFAAISYIIIYMQFGKWRKKENVVEALVEEKRKVLCEGEWKEYVVCSYVDEMGEKHIFESEKMTQKIKLSEGDAVEVLIDPDDCHNYFVQIGVATISWRRV